MAAVDERPDGFDPDIRRENEELDRDELLSAYLGLVRERARAGEAPDDHDAGEPSMAESMPKPISAIDPAAMPATIATRPSIAM